MISPIENSFNGKNIVLIKKYSEYDVSVLVFRDK